MRARDNSYLVEVLVSTIKREPIELVNAMRIRTDCVVICQDGREEYELKVENGRSIKIYHTHERGLSRSRNMAMHYAIGDICLFADDDLTYLEDYAEKVQLAYQQIPEADLIIFNYNTSDQTRRKKRLGSEIRRLGFADCLSVSTVMITFRRERVLRKEITFNKLFGSGSEFPSGEENIFLFDCLRRGLKIYYYPAEIATVRFENSSWFNGFNERYFAGKGALGYMLFGKYHLLFILQFAIRKYMLYKHQMGILPAIRHMMYGRRKCAVMINRQPDAG